MDSDSTQSPFLESPRPSLKMKWHYWIVAVSLMGIIGIGFFCIRDLQQHGENSVILQDPSKTGLEAGFHLPRPFHTWGDGRILHEFENWVVQHGKKYIHEAERLFRFNIFKQNLAYIMKHNEQGFTYRLKLNHFADLTHHEFNKSYVGYRGRSMAKKSLGVDEELNWIDASELPKSVNWMEKGCVTPVKDQRQCGSCWAFSTTGAIEGTFCATTGKLVNLSEQQLVDCADKEGNMGCDGGQMDGGFEYVIDNHGLCSEEAYPYEAVKKQCRARRCQPVVHVKGFKDVPRYNEAALMAAIALRGPVSVAIEADQAPFQFYSDGVMDASCGNNLDHGVLVVGYGTDEPSGEDYWVVKNSWGPDWGDQGFIKLARHVKQGVSKYSERREEKRRAERDDG
eukprot:GHVU01081919.1.p1 GENE.GHVU01081919.1~~GHVU01081919.1.p1  ORF type:complete len:396 (+),score=55.75 GHVU01081919.1:72-1259(+)